MTMSVGSHYNCNHHLFTFAVVSSKSVCAFTFVTFINFQTFSTILAWSRKTELLYWKNQAKGAFQKCSLREKVIIHLSFFMYLFVTTCNNQNWNKISNCTGFWFLNSNSWFLHEQTFNNSCFIFHAVSGTTLRMVPMDEIARQWHTY